jgi:hypothetical protein
MLTRTRILIACAAAAAVTATVGASAPAWATTATSGAAAAKTAAATTTVQDRWEQTNHNINLSATGGVSTPIMTLNLPAGKWVLHADQTMVNFGPSDYAGCEIGDTANSDLNAHNNIVGDPNATGAQGPASFVDTLSETAAVSLSAPTTVTITCGHNDTNGSTPYINSNADLWAHRSANLVITQLP